MGQLHFVQSTFCPKFWGKVKNCLRKNMISLGPYLTHHGQNYPHYRSGLRTKSRLWILITRIRITQIQITQIRNMDGPKFTIFLCIQFFMWPLTNDASTQNFWQIVHWTKCNGRKVFSCGAFGNWVKAVSPSLRGGDFIYVYCIMYTFTIYVYIYNTYIYTYKMHILYIYNTCKHVTWLFIPGYW